MGTKSQSTVDAIKAIDEDIDNIAKEPFTEADVKRAKDDILSAFVFRLDSPDKILAERMSMTLMAGRPNSRQPRP